MTRKIQTGDRVRVQTPGSTSYNEPPADFLATVKVASYARNGRLQSVTVIADGEPDTFANRLHIYGRYVTPA